MIFPLNVASWCSGAALTCVAVMLVTVYSEYSVSGEVAFLM